MKDSRALAPWIKHFLLQYLPADRNFARNTQHSYRDALRLLVIFASTTLHRKPDELLMEELSADLVRSFMRHIEETRECSVSTRNQRLAAVRTLAAFIGERSPEHLLWCAQLRSVPFKRSGHRPIGYLEKNEIGPKCQTQARQRWLAARERELLTTNYFHVVFTVPHELNVLALENPRAFYDLLFAASAQTLLEIAIDRKHLGAEIGLISILHTWGQILLLHPHIHCAIPAGGLSPDHHAWIRPRYPFFLPVKVLSRVFRGKFLAGLKRLHRRNQLCCAGPAAALADPQQFAKLTRRLHRHDWVVYAKPAFGGPVQVLRYLGRYTHRVAISNHRLLAFDQERVTFRWKDYAHGGKQGKMTLAATEFLRRFFLHVLPRGFVRIRHFGFLANRWRSSRLALSRQLLSSNSTPPDQAVTGQASSEASSLWHCPRCGATMIVMQRFTPAELSTCTYFDSS